MFNRETLKVLTLLFLIGLLFVLAGSVRAQEDGVTPEAIFTQEATEEAPVIVVPTELPTQEVPVIVIPAPTDDGETVPVIVMPPVEEDEPMQPWQVMVMIGIGIVFFAVAALAGFVGTRLYFGAQTLDEAFWKVDKQTSRYGNTFWMQSANNMALQILSQVDDPSDTAVAWAMSIIARSIKNENNPVTAQMVSQVLSTIAGAAVELTDRDNEANLTPFREPVS